MSASLAQRDGLERQRRKKVGRFVGHGRACSGGWSLRHQRVGLRDVPGRDLEGLHGTRPLVVDGGGRFTVVATSFPRVCEIGGAPGPSRRRRPLAPPYGVSVDRGRSEAIPPRRSGHDASAPAIVDPPWTRRRVTRFWLTICGIGYPVSIGAPTSRAGRRPRGVCNDTATRIGKRPGGTRARACTAGGRNSS